MNGIIEEIKQFCVTETQKIITDLQQERFGHQGQFNDHPAWADNYPTVIGDKGLNQPLVDSGELEHELSTPDNWNLNPVSSPNKLTLTIPEKENFTESKYDVLDTGGAVSPYVSPRGNFMPIKSVPARPFKKLSKQDADWIVKKLVDAIREKFA